MGDVSLILPAIRDRMIAHAGFNGVWTAARVRIATGAEDLDIADPIMAVLQLSAFNLVDDDLERGVVRVHVLVRNHTDRAEDRTAAIARVAELQRDVRRHLSRSFLGGSVDEALRVVTASAPAVTDRERQYVSAYVDFECGVIVGIPHVATVDGGETLDQGQA